MEELIAKRYATALSSVSQNIQDTSAVLNALSDAICTPEVKVLLTSPIVSSEKKTEMVLSSVEKNDDKVLVNFIKVLGENKRLDLIPAIAKVLNATLQKESNEYEGVLKSKTTLSQDEVVKLEKTLEKYTGSSIKLTQETTELDGLRVLVDDLGIEVNFSKQRVKEQLIDFIKKSL
jgi:F-type H+-transporting ATPase subunit delta